MKREIKFRAWDVRYNKMRQKVCVGNLHDDENYTAHSLYLRPGDTDYKIEEPGQWMHFDEHSEVFIMQYTGLKETTTGVDVYEGDIVKYQHSKDSPEYIGTIHYKEDFASFWLTTNGDTGFALLGAQKIITVLGNIHQHPNLIK